jgi:hypothetical protein
MRSTSCKFSSEASHGWYPALEIVRGHLTEQLRQALEIGKIFVRNRTPIGATGNLQQSLITHIEPDASAFLLTGIISSSSSYVQFVEEDTLPHWVPIAPLKLWARIKLGDERLAYAVQWAIRRRGTRGQHMFAQSEEQVGVVANAYIARAVANIERDLSGDTNGA